MKINGIKALDYQCQGDSLTLTLTETDFETVSNLNTALVEVRTDDGDLVEAHGGYALRAADQQLRGATLPAARGEIYAADGTLLAASETCWTIRAIATSSAWRR